MKTKHHHLIFLLWLFASLLLTTSVFLLDRAMLDTAVRTSVQQHLQLTLDESLFSAAENQTNDRKGLQRIGEQMNAALQDLVSSRWYAAHTECAVQLQQLDDVLIADEPAARSISLSLPRNQIEREIRLGLSCSPNVWLAIGIGVGLALLFAAIASALPPPLSKAHRHWINYLLARGYSGTEAFDVLHRFDATDLELNEAQLTCLEQLHDQKQHNIGEVLDLVTDQQVAALDKEDIDWFLLGLRLGNGELGIALDLAMADDGMVIDLNQSELRIRHVSVPMSRTPLFYYAWYAMSRLEGEGWIRNPASNRPDPTKGMELAQMMARFDGHAKAIKDLEQAGLKARTLDQNRSKIKEDVVAVLGEKLAANFLFEASKDPDGVHMRYRMQLEAGRIEVIA